MKGDRDKRGWRVPRKGSVARDVYDCLVVGCSHQRIEGLLGLSAKRVAREAWAIRNPEVSNSYMRAYRIRKRSHEAHPG